MRGAIPSQPPPAERGEDEFEEGLPDTAEPSDHDGGSLSNYGSQTDHKHALTDANS